MKMEVKIHAAGAIILTDELTDFIHKKTEKLLPFLKDDPAGLVEVEVKTITGHRSGDVYKCDINVTLSGAQCYAESEKDKLHNAIAEAMSEMRREVKRYRTKNRDHIRKGSGRVKEFLRGFGKR